MARREAGETLIDMPAMLAGGTLRALPTLLPFWLVLSFARDALVHLNAIVCSVAAVSERPDTPPSARRAGSCHNAVCLGAS